MGITFAALIILILGGLELLLRLVWGLGKRPLYIADKEIGYLLAPNQQLRRVGNLMVINQYSQRTETITQERPDNTFRILLLGDSIANGAWWTDQEQTISALIETQLSDLDDQQIQVLNASANSWGPRNQLAYLQRFDTFNAQIIMLLLNTDDLFATAPTSLAVGKDINLPTYQQPLAVLELLERMVKRKRDIPGMAEVVAEPGDRVGFNLAAINQIQQIAKENNSQFLLAITPLLREVNGTKRRKYEQKARERLQNFCRENNITFLDFIPIFQRQNEVAMLYRDTIHLTEKGNQLVSQQLSTIIQNKIN